MRPQPHQLLTTKITSSTITGCNPRQTGCGSDKPKSLWSPRTTGEPDRGDILQDPGSHTAFPVPTRACATQRILCCCPSGLMFLPTFVYGVGIQRDRPSSKAVEGASQLQLCTCLEFQCLFSLMAMCFSTFYCFVLCHYWWAVIDIRTFGILMPVVFPTAAMFLTVFS